MKLSLAERGALHFPGAVLDGLPKLAALLSNYDNGEAGIRIARDPRLREWLATNSGLADIIKALGLMQFRPVRAILFDKSPTRNWSLGWHQDRTICIEREHATPGFGPFSRKQGLTHVEPPFSLIERMRTLRIHLDPVDDRNSPLLVAEGSHAIGRVAAELVDSIAKEFPITACHAAAGDIWVYATSILHASQRNQSNQRRRVLQIDYSQDTLPEGLDWLEI